MAEVATNAGMDSYWIGKEISELGVLGEGGGGLGRVDVDCLIFFQQLDTHVYVYIFLL